MVKGDVATALGPILTKVIHALQQDLDLDDIYDLVKDQLLTVMLVQRIVVSFLDTERARLLAYVLHDDLPGEVVTGFSIPKLYHGPWKAVLTGEAVVARPITSSSTPADSPLAKQGIRSYICLPIVARGETVGILELDSDAKGESEVFGKEHVALLRPLTELLGLALERQRNLDAVKDLTRKSQTVRALGQLALRGGSLDAFLMEAMTGIQAAFGYANCGYFQVDSAVQELVLTHTAGNFKREQKLWTRHSVEQGLLGRAYRMATVVLCNDTEKDPDHEKLPEMEVRSMLVIPVVLGIEVEGLVVISSPSVSHFREQDIAISEMLGLIVAMKVASEKVPERLIGA